MTYEKLKIISAYHPGFAGYELAKRPSIIGNDTFDSLVSVSGIVKDVYYRDVDWRLPIDIQYTGGFEEKPDLNPNELFILKGKTMRRPGIWANNGFPATSEQMLMWKPGAITVFYDYIDNGLIKYKQDNPGAVIIVRFNHPQNWRDDITNSAYARGREVASKWDTLKNLDPYVYVGNEVNLHYENGDNDAGNQYKYETREFYQQWGRWVEENAKVIKDLVPEMKLVCPPFASGHHEDGAPDDDGNPKEPWAGFDYLYETIAKYFNNIICHHDYWGHAGGCVEDWLYGSETSTWYAFRWKRVAKLFKVSYNKDIKIIIDECGNMQANHPNVMQQVIYYSTKCLQDPRIIALTYFLWNDPTNGGQGSPGNVMNSWAQRIPNLQSHIQRLKDMPDVAIVTPAIPPVTPPVIPPPVIIVPPITPPVTPPAPVYNTLEYTTGLGMALIVGDYGVPDIEITVIGPKGGVRWVKTGTKTEFGPGGFELYAFEPGEYTLKAEGYIWKIQMLGKFIRITKFNKGIAVPGKKVVLTSSVISESQANEILNLLGDKKSLFTMKEVA